MNAFASSWAKRALGAIAGVAMLGSVVVPGVAMAADGTSAASGAGTAWAAEAYSSRALTVVPTDQGVLATWRLYADDAADTTFTLKRGDTVVYTGTTTNFTDKDGKPGDTYTLSADKGSYKAETATAWQQDYLTLDLQAPEPQQMPANQTAGVDQVATYTANDMSPADLNGDGQLDLVVKWDPSNWQDNYYAGFTGTTFLDGYTFDHNTGKTTRLWRVNLGVNIRSGPHYTQFQVWDYDGDGKAEVLVKTSDGTSTYKDEGGALVETGHVGDASAEDLPTDVISGSAKHDYRMSGKASDPKDKKNGKINSGPEYLTAFAGDDGHIIDTTQFEPSRDDGLWHWGPSDANIVDRFLAATAYLDGPNGKPYAVFSRGYYFRTEIATYSLQDGKLKLNWHFRANKDTQSGRDPSWVENPDFAQQGFHNLSINDLDGDGKDDIVFGSMSVRSDGTGLASSKLGHGDALHVSDWNDDGVLDEWNVHEGKRDATLTNPATGQVMFRQTVSSDNGRGMAADIDARYQGAELWSANDPNTYNAVTPAPSDKSACTATNPTPCVQKVYSNVKPASANFSLYWDGDLLNELFEYSGTQDPSITTAHQDRVSPQIQKWNPETQTTDVIWEDAAASTNNGSKGNASLIGDIMGDWRDEVIVRDTKNANQVRLYSTNIATPYSISTSLNSRAYREGLAWQNTAYNQPAHREAMISAGLTVPTVTAVKNGAKASVTWTAATDGRVWGVGVSGYRVYRAEQGSTDFTAVKDVDASTLRFDDSGLDAAKGYTYRVAALIDGNPYYQSFDASTAAGTVPDPSGDLAMADGYPQVVDANGSPVALTAVDGKTDTFAGTVAKDNKTVTVTAKAADAANVVYIGSKKVETRVLTLGVEGLNRIHVFVKSADGKQSRDYTLEITRADAAKPQADKSRLTRLIEAYSDPANLKESDYTADSWAKFQEALESAKAVAADENATQDEVDAAVTALTAAKQALVKAETPAKVDKSRLTALIAAYSDPSNLAEGDYTEAGWAAFQKALDAAKAVAADENATQEQVDAAVTALTAAKTELVDHNADKQAPAIALAEGTEQNPTLEYGADFDPMDGVTVSDDSGREITPDVTIAYQSAQDEAAAPVDAVDTTKAGIYTVTYAAKDAAGHEATPLVRVVTVKAKAGAQKPDKSALQSLVNDAKSKVKDQYTATSWDALEQALANAERVLADENATAEQVTAAQDALAAAIAGLETKPAVPPTDGDGEGDGTGDGAGDGDGQQGGSDQAADQQGGDQQGAGNEQNAGEQSTADQGTADQDTDEQAGDGRSTLSSTGASVAAVAGAAALLAAAGIGLAAASKRRQSR